MADTAQPRKKKKKKSASNAGSYKNSPLRFAILGLLLAVLGTGLFLLLQKRENEKSSSVASTATTDNTDATPLPLKTLPQPTPAQNTPDGKAPDPNPTKAEKPRPFSMIEWLAVPPTEDQVAASGYVSLGGGRGRVAACLRAWDREKGSPLNGREFSHPEVRGTGPIAFSPDGKVLAALDHSVVVFFDFASQKVISAAKLPTAKTSTTPSGITFTSDGKALVLIVAECLVTAQVSDGAVEVKRPKDFPGAAAVFLPTQNRVVDVRRSANYQSIEIATWNPATGEEPNIITLEGVKGFVSKFGISAQGDFVAISVPLINDQEQVVIYNTVTGKLIRTFPPDDAKAFRSYRSIKVSPDGKYLAAIGDGDVTGEKFKSVDLFRISDGKRLFREMAGPNQSPSETFATGLTFDPTGKFLYYIRGRNTVCSLDVTTGIPRPAMGAN